MAYAIRNLEPTAGAPGLRRRIVAIALAAMAFVPCTAGDAAADLRSDREKVWRNDYRPVPPPRVIDTFALIEVERPPPRDNSFWDADAEPMAQAIERELAAMFTRAATTKTGEERIVVRVTNLGWKSGGGFDQVVEPTLVLLDAEDGRELFRVTRRSPQNLRAYYLDVADLFGLFKSDIAEAFGRPALAALQGGAARRRGGAAVTEAGGRYAAERDLAFNVLDAVEFHPETQETVLVGHYEHRFAGRRTPYLQHLAALLENPAPEFSLDWTPDSERRVEAFLARMDSLEEMHGLDAVSGQWLSPDGLPTAQGRLMLPLFGVKPTRNGSAAGALGASVSPTADFEGVRIDRVAPGSAAERAGLKPGDVIHFFAERDMIYPTEFVRQVAFAGAGASVPVVGMRADGNPFRLQVTLDASPEDPWRHVTRHDIGAQMFRQIGMAKAARVLEALDVARRLVKTPAGPKTAFVMFDATESWGVYEAVMAAQARKEIALPEAQRRMQRAVVEGTEGAFRLPPGTLVAYFDGAMRRGANSSQAFSEAMLRLDEKIEPLLKDMLRTLLRRNDEIALPVTEADTRFGGRPEVVPRFDGVDPATPLARLLYEADYLGKSLIHRPELKNRIPGYKTEYAFEGAGGSAASTTHRMWISVDGVAASEEGKRLVLGEPRMRFNIREVRSGRDVPAQPGGYEELLTGLYTVLAEEFPALHELREAAKLARAAQWLRAKAPDLRLPEEGRSRWTAPRSASGLVYLIWSPNQVKVSMVAAGGVTLRVPPVGPGRPLVPLLPGPSASGGAMDLRDLGATVSWPEPYDDRILAGALARRTDARPSRPLGWTASVGTGRHSAIGVSAVPAACAAAEDTAPGRTLETAGGIALKLGAVENALGALGRPGPGRNVAVASLDTALRAASDGFVRDGVEAMTQDLLDALDAAERDTAGPTIDDLYRGAAAAKEAKSASAALSERLSRIRRSYEAAGVDDSVGRERAISELGALAKDVLAGGARRQAGSAATASRAERLKGIVEGVDPLLALGRASRALKAAPPPGEQDLARLRDALLAMQRRLSDELDGALAAPAFAAWLGESGSGVCGEKVRLAVTQPPGTEAGTAVPAAIAPRPTRLASLPATEIPSSAEAEALARSADAILAPPPIPETVKFDYGTRAEWLNRALTATDFFNEGVEILGMATSLTSGALKVTLPGLLLLGGKVVLAGQEGAEVFLLKQDAATKRALDYLADKDEKKRLAFSRVVQAVRLNLPVSEPLDPDMVSAARAILDPRNAESHGDFNTAGFLLLGTPEARMAMVNKLGIEVGGKVLGAYLAKAAARAKPLLEDSAFFSDDALKKMIQWAPGSKGRSLSEAVPVDANAVKEAFETLKHIETEGARSEVARNALRSLQLENQFLDSGKASKETAHAIAVAIPKWEALIAKSYAASMENVQESVYGMTISSGLEKALEFHKTLTKKED